MKSFIRHLIFLSVLLANTKVHAEIQIQPYKKTYSWKSEWSQVIIEELKKDQYRNGEGAMLNVAIDQEDLNELDCPGYANASLDEKSEFWVVFFSALTRAESGFNEKAKSAMSRGHRSYGLLQLAKQTAKTQCLINPRWGYRNFETRDDSSNVWWVALLSAGEGWHNNHHAQSNCAAHGRMWWEFDLTWQIIKGLEFIGLATDVKRPIAVSMVKKFQIDNSSTIDDNFEDEHIVAMIN